MRSVGEGREVDIGVIASLRTKERAARVIIREQDGVYSAQHVTGPTHNLLRLTLERGEAREFDVEVLPPVGSCRHHDGLTAQEVMPPIRAGVASANAALGTNFAVVHAEIVENDSRQPAVYEYITRKIVEETAKRLKG